MKHSDDVRRQFGGAAEAYAKCKVQSNDFTLDRLITLTNPKENWTVCDVACGAGHTALRFSPLVAGVYAVDLTPEMLAQVKMAAHSAGATNIQTIQSNAEMIPLSDQSVDLVTCRLAIHHFVDPDLFFNEAARILKPGGILAVVDSHLPDDPALDDINTIQKIHDPSHAACLTREQFEKLYSQHGFTLDALEEGTVRLGFKTWTTRVGLDKESTQKVRSLMVTPEHPETANVLKLTSDPIEDFLFSFQRIVLIGRKDTL